MKLILDTVTNELSVHDQTGQRSLPLYGKEAFEVLSQEWLRLAWNQKYPYTFTWLGRPVIQLPEDMLRAQEILWRIKPDVIIETGVAHGGSLIYYASLCRLFGRGRVIGIDIEIRAPNRKAISEHPLSSLITLIEGSSIDARVLQDVKSRVNPGDTVLVFLDSNHSKQHVLRELYAYSPLVTKGSYIVATDGIMKFLSDVPRGQAQWASDNPIAAVEEFVASNPDFVVEQPEWIFNESELNMNLTYWPHAWAKRTR